jgi:hypothetical protein
MSENTVKVCRPGIFGNPWTVSEILSAERENGGAITPEQAQAAAVDSYRAWLAGGEFEGTYPACTSNRDAILKALPSLRGRNLACWCRLDQPCHADVLLELANA